MTIAQPPSARPHLLKAMEAGLPPSLIDAWFGVVAPVKTDRTSLDGIDGETRKVLVLPDGQ